MPAPSPLRRAPAPRVSACAIPAPPEPWVADARRAAAGLHAVPAFLPAAPPTPETDGVHRPRGEGRAVAVAAALAGATVLSMVLR